MSDTFEQLQQTGDSSSRNTDFDTTIVIKLATIGWTGTIGNVGFYKFDSLPTKELLEDANTLPDQEGHYPPEFSGYSSQCIHIYKVVEEFTSDSNWDNSNHSIALDKNVVIEDDIKITVTTADTTRSLTYSSNQWKKDINNKVYLPLSVISGYLQEADAEPRRGTSADIKAARSKSLILKLDHDLRNDFTITIEYSGVIDSEGDVGGREPLYDLYGISKPTGADENTFYNAILLGDKSSPDVLPIATRYVGTSITLPSDDDSGFAAYVKVRSYTDIESFIDYTVYSPDYEEHIERARTYLVDTTDAESGETIPGEHPHVLDPDYNRADKTNIEGTWNAITGVANIVTTPLPGPVPDYSQSDPKLYVGTQGSVLGPSGSCAGKGYCYDANIWYYWSDLDIRNAFAQLAGIDVPVDFDLSPQYVGFDSRSGSFLYGFYHIPHNNGFEPYIIVGGSNSYHFVDIYKTDETLFAQLHQTNLTGEDPVYRTKLFRWFDSLYASVGDQIVYITPSTGLARAFDTWQDITISGGTTNYLYHQIRLHPLCTCTYNTETNIYLTEFSDLGDVAIQYNKENDQLNYVGLAPMESIDGTGTEAAVLIQIDEPNAFKDVLNFYDIEYTDKQRTLEMLYRQSAFHIKWLTDHNYKIVYLGARYSVGYDAINEMYLILMKNTVRSSFRRTRQKKADFAARDNSHKQVVFDSGNSTERYFIYGSQLAKDGHAVELSVVNGDTVDVSVNGQLYSNLSNWQGSSSWYILQINSDMYLQDADTTTIKFNDPENINLNNIFPIVIEKHLPARNKIQSFLDDYFVTDSGEVVKLTNMNNRYSITNGLEFLDANRGVLVVKHPSIAGYFRFLHSGGN